MQIMTSTIAVTAETVEEATALVDALDMAIDATDDTAPGDRPADPIRQLRDARRALAGDLYAARRLYALPSTFTTVFLGRVAAEGLHMGLAILRDWSQEPDAAPEVAKREALVIAMLANLEVAT